MKTEIQKYRNTEIQKLIDSSVYLKGGKSMSDVLSQMEDNELVAVRDYVQKRFN